MATADELIDEQIRKLQSLRELAKDPALAGLFQKLAAEAAEVRRPEIEPDRPSIKEVVRNTTVVIDRSALPVYRGTHTGLSDEIRKVIKTQTGRFTHMDILRTIRESGFQIKAGNPAVAVSAVLRRFMDSGEISKVGVSASGSFEYEKPEKGATIATP